MSLLTCPTLVTFAPNINTGDTGNLKYSADYRVSVQREAGVTFWSTSELEK